MEVDDLFTDLADGKKLLKLLEIISGERLAKPNNGRMRVHKIENVNKSLAFLHTKVMCIPEMACVFSFSLSLSFCLFGLRACVSSEHCSHSRKPLESERSTEVQRSCMCVGRTNNFVCRGINKVPRRKSSRERSRVPDKLAGQ